MNKSEPAQHGGIFTETQPNVREWFRRRVRSEARSCLGRVHEKAGATREQGNNHGECRTWMAQHLNCQQGAADRANDSMHRVPSGIEPWNFVRKKLQKIQNAGNRDDPGISEDPQRLILWRESNPVKMDGQPGNENSEIKIDASQTRQA